MNKIITEGVPPKTFAYLNSEGYYIVFKKGKVIPSTAPKPTLRAKVSGYRYTTKCIYCGENYGSHRAPQLSFPYACPSIKRSVDRQPDFIDADLSNSASAGMRSANYFYQPEKKE